MMCRAHSWQGNDEFSCGGHDGRTHLSSQGRGAQGGGFREEDAPLTPGRRMEGMTEDEPDEALDAALHLLGVRRVDKDVRLGKGPLDILPHGLVQVALISAHEFFGLAAQAHRTPFSTTLGDAPGERVDSLVPWGISGHEEESRTVDFPKGLDLFLSLERVQDEGPPRAAMSISIRSCRMALKANHAIASARFIFRRSTVPARMCSL